MASKVEGNGYILYHGRCEKILSTLPAASVDAVICDPPYPCIDRSYGKMTEAEWFALMRVVVPECMCVLKPTGSAVFVLQPNSERVGRMRTWLWEFMVWVGKEYGIVQDVWWWNYTVLPAGHAIQGRLMRPSIKACVWVGSSDCYRNQDAVLWHESDENAAARNGVRLLNDRGFPKKDELPSGHGVNRVRCAESAVKRGGVTPFNCLPIANADSSGSAGASGHGAGTPLALCSWWTRYICPPGGVILDPFSGTATVGIAALRHGCSYIGIEKEAEYHAVAEKRLRSRGRYRPPKEGDDKPKGIWAALQKPKK